MMNLDSALRRNPWPFIATDHRLQGDSTVSRQNALGPGSAGTLLGVLLLCVLAQPTPAQTPIEALPVAAADQIAQFHINNGEYLVDRGEYLEANAEFTAAQTTAQSRQLKAESLSWLGQMAATFLDKPELALGDYRRVAEEYRGTEAYSGALFQLGMLSYQRQDLKGARGWFERFQKEFPNGEQAGTAAFMLEKIANLEAKRQLPPKPAPPVVGKSIRVRLAVAPEVEISAGGEFQAPGAQFKFKNATTFTVVKGNLTVGSDSLGAGPVELTANAPLRFKGRRYRGTLILSVRKQQIMVVNRLPLEEYLYSVVGSEMSPHWPLEALKAQAVASRSYAAYHIAHPPSTEYDLVDDTHSQEYEGTGREADSTRSAVDATKGEVRAWQGEVILAAFTSNNGGRSADSQAIFGVSYPYFAVKDDPFSRLEPFGHWERHFTAREIETALANFGISAGNVTDVQVAATDGSGRATEIDVVSGTQALRVSARSQFRVALNRYSRQHAMPENIPETLFTVTRAGDVYTIAGGGWGHGVGMSQHGARARAEAGQDYVAILTEYYPRTDKMQLY